MRTRARSVGRRIGKIDLALFQRVVAAETPLLDRTMPRLSRAANHSALWLATAAVAAAVGGRRGRRAALRGVLAIGAASAIVNLPGKLGTRRPRPPLEHVPIVRQLARVPTSWSFPSGHSASAAAFATGMSIEVPALAPVLGAAALGVAYSRVHTGVHYPGDVLAGVLVGAAAGVATLRPFPRARLHAAAELTEAAPDAPARPTGEGTIVVVNPGAGSDELQTLTATVRDRLPEARVVVGSPDGDLKKILEEAAQHAEILAIAGGDGSIGPAAAAARRHAIPLLVLPIGTLNHFADELGLADADAAFDALASGRAIRIDLATVGAETYVNLASIGGYPEVVDARRRFEDRIGKWPATVLGTLHVLRHGRPLELTVDGSARRVWMLIVGNGHFEPRGYAPTDRPRLDGGELDVRIVRADRRGARARLLLGVLLGTLARSAVYDEELLSELHVRSDGRVLRAARDGEPFQAPPETTFRVHPRSLTVYAGRSGG